MLDGFELNTPDLKGLSHIQVDELGCSEEGRPLCAYRVGRGKRKLSLIAGCHSDEPLGPHTLRRLLAKFAREPEHPWLEQATFHIQPHMNPDGEARNRVWIEAWPDPVAYLEHAFREKPGRDVEFGFPSMRPENELWSNWLESFGPMDMHMSLHGMGVSEGWLLLIEKQSMDRVKGLKARFVDEATRLGYELHDHDRKGDKGFLYGGPGFTSTPEGQAMRAYFEDRGDLEMAQLFHSSSMEFVMSLSRAKASLSLEPCLCMVTELPLFVIGQPRAEPSPGRPARYLQFKSELAMAQTSEALKSLVEKFQLKSLPIDLGSKVQLQIVEWGLEELVKSSQKSAEKRT